MIDFTDLETHFPDTKFCLVNGVLHANDVSVKLMWTWEDDVCTTLPRNMQEESAQRMLEHIRFHLNINQHGIEEALRIKQLN